MLFRSTRIDYLQDGLVLGMFSPPVLTFTWNTATVSNGSHSLSAKAYDAAGHVTTSAAVAVNVSNVSNDTTSPAVSITAPAAGATVTATVTVSATASDNVGVVGVQFKLDGASLGLEVTTAPYSTTWNAGTAANGTHTLTALARDAAGNTATAAAVTVTVSTSTPPPPGTRSPYKGVPFAVPGVIEAEDFDIGGEGVTWHDLVAGNQGGFYRTNTDVDIIAPVGNAVGAVVNNFQTGEWLEYTISVAQTGTYRLEAAVSSEFATSRWHAEIDGVNVTGSVAVPNTGWWGTFQWIGVGGIPLAAGQHVLRLYADEEYFNIDSLRFVTETSPPPPPDTTAPTVSITAPAGGATVSGTVTVSAQAQDNQAVAGVQFLLNGAPLGAEDTAAPYEISWDTTTAANGPYTLTAVARDAAGNTATAPVVMITVSNPVPAGLVAAYSFNEGSGGTALDSSGNGADGTISGATWTNRGRYGNGLSFDGVSSLVRGPDVTLGATFTIMAWVANPRPAAYETIATVGTNRDLFLGNGAISFFDGSAEHLFGSAISRRAWHHVAIVSDGSTLVAYLDGAPAGEPQAVSLGSITGTLQVGAWVQGASNFDFFSGRIDEVRVYSRALTQTEIQTDMSAPIVP